MLLKIEEKENELFIIGFDSFTSMFFSFFSFLNRQKKTRRKQKITYCLLLTFNIYDSRKIIRYSYLIFS